jgi:hypothetical protein
MIDVRVAEFEAHGAGLSVVPSREDGRRRPDVDSCKEFQSRRPSDAEVGSLYGNSRPPLGVVCSAVSGGLEMLELEGRAVAVGSQEGYRELAEAAGLDDIESRIHAGDVERTASGGFHIREELNYTIARRVIELPCGRRSSGMAAVA